MPLCLNEFKRSEIWLRSHKHLQYWRYLSFCEWSLQSIMMLIVVCFQGRDESWLFRVWRWHGRPRQGLYISIQQSAEVKGSASARFVILLQQRWRGYSNGAVYVWLGEWVDTSMCLSIAICLVSTTQTTVFAWSLSNFTCKLFMMRGGTLLILGQRSRSDLALCVCIKPCGHDTGYNFCPIIFKLHM